LKSGSTEFRTASALVSRMSSTIDSLLDASIAWAEKRPSSSPSQHLGGPPRVVVGQSAVLEERAAPGDLRECGADAPCPDDEYPHGARVLHDRSGL
jgi:hypothetical protein